MTWPLGGQCPISGLGVGICGCDNCRELQRLTEKIRAAQDLAQPLIEQQPGAGSWTGILHAYQYDGVAQDTLCECEGCTKPAEWRIGQGPTLYLCERHCPTE